MSVVWITGISGSGKSSVCEALKDRGYRAIDADWEGFNHWVHRLTGEVAIDPPYPVPPGWLDEYAWRISTKHVRELASSSGANVTFLCGSVENEDEVREYFDIMVGLVADEETIVGRLGQRTTNAFGKHPEELAAVLASNRTEADRYRKLGALIVDAARPLGEVVRDVLATAGARGMDAPGRAPAQRSGWTDSPHALRNPHQRHLSVSSAALPPAGSVGSSEATPGVCPPRGRGDRAA